MLTAMEGIGPFPKAIKWMGESDKACALRELAEETGITDVDLVTEKVFHESYFFTRDNTKTAKQAHYFIGYIHDTTVVPQEAEIQDYIWLPIESATEKLTFQGVKNVLRNVHTFINETKITQELK